jgi:3-hydroxyacyl-CoA dehydrogenase
MKLLEVVRGKKISTEVLSSVMVLAKRIGKVPVVSGVCYGFIGNRMLEGYLREAEFLLLEGANASQIDRAIEGIGMAMGPCRMIDMAGVDVAAKVVLANQKAGGLPADPAYRVVVRKLYEHGRMGQKTSSGYYRYEGRAAIEDQHLTNLCVELAGQLGIRRRSTIADGEIVERCLLPLINEGARILEEGIAYRAGDIDVVWVNGYGFPAYKGGPMHMAAIMGEDNVVSRLAHYAASLGNPHGYWTASNWWNNRASGAPVPEGLQPDSPDRDPN